MRYSTQSLTLSGVNGQTAVSRVCEANKSSTLVFEFRENPDDTNGIQPGAIASSHKGPCQIYAKKVDSALTNNTAAGDGWFKLWEEYYDESVNKWCTEKLIDNNGLLPVTLPEDLAGGYYLLRPELLALHNANQGDPQFFLGCAQLFLKSDSTGYPSDTVSIPGYVDMSNPAMTFNIYETPMALPYPGYGPAVYNGSSTTGSKSNKAQSKIAVKQTLGLKPAGCILQNANWCGYEVPSYTNETGCWNVRYPPHIRLPSLPALTSHLGKPRLLEPRQRMLGRSPSLWRSQLQGLGQ